MKYTPLQYHDYLGLQNLTNSQKLRSEELGTKAHDEMLFIIVHQVYELWFRQIIWELDSALENFSKDHVSEEAVSVASKRLNRVVLILRHILGQIDILETMTPMDFLDFREYLYPASGFQSFQFRLIETKLGLKIEDRVAFNQTPFYNHLHPDQKQLMMDALNHPTLLESIEKWLERMPFLASENFSFWDEYKKAVEQMFANDIETIKTNPRLSEEEKQKNIQMMNGALKMSQSIFDEGMFKELQKTNYFQMSFKAIKSALMIQLYRDQSLFHAPYQVMMHLLDIDELLTQWRYRHALMAHRMLGKKIGTGGSSGHDYLKSATEKHKIFNDFFNLSTFLIPRSKVPELPAQLKEKMRFNY